MLSARAKFLIGALTWISANRICPWSTVPNDQLVCGDRMSTRIQPKTWKAEFFLPMVVIIGALFFFVAANASSSIQSMDTHSTDHSSVIAASADCPASTLGSSHAHCQNSVFGPAVGSRLIQRLLPISGSNAWYYASVTCNPAPTDPRLLRPPQFFCAPV